MIRGKVKYLYAVVAAIGLMGCMPDTYRHLDGDETLCYLCLGFYQSHGDKEVLIDADNDAIKAAIEQAKQVKEKQWKILIDM